MENNWREIKRGLGWDEADALRSSTLRDTPSLDVRLVAVAGSYSVEVSGPVRK